MSRHRFVEDLKGIEAQVLDMADLARGMLHDGLDSLMHLDGEKAGEVVTRGEPLADMDESIEQEILQFLTLQSPVAGDLRHIGAALKLITYLNRVGRYGYDIARLVGDWPAGRPDLPKAVGIREMGARVEGMLDLVLEAYREGKAPDVDALLVSEEEVDAQRWAIFRQCLTYMAEDPKNIEPSAHTMMVARYLERTGDNICKMAEKIHYAMTGKRVLIG